MKKTTFLILMLAFGAFASRAAILTTEFFNTDPGTVVNRDGNMIVNHNGTNMSGAFASQPFPLPEVDAFSITHPSFMGDYTGSGLTQIAFDMFASTVAPSVLSLILIDGANVFTYQFASLAGITTTFTTFTADLLWSAGWSGVSEAAFNTALTSIDEIQIEIARNTTAAQVYYLDNLQTLGGGGPGPGPSAVPEPNVVNLLLFVAMLSLAARRYVALSAT